jgi:hypothetical protein
MRIQDGASVGKSRIMVRRLKRAVDALASELVRNIFGTLRVAWMAERHATGERVQVVGIVRIEAERERKSMTLSALRVATRMRQRFHVEGVVGAWREGKGKAKGQQKGARRRTTKLKRRQLRALGRARDVACASVVLAGAVTAMKLGLGARAATQVAAVARAVAAGAGALVRRVWLGMVATFEGSRVTNDEGWQKVQGFRHRARAGADSDYSAAETDGYDWNCDKCGGHLNRACENRAGDSVCARCMYLCGNACEGAERLVRKGAEAGEAVTALREMDGSYNVSSGMRHRMGELMDCAQGARCGRAAGVSRGETQQQQLGVLQDSCSNSDNISDNSSDSSDSDKGYESSDDDNEMRERERLEEREMLISLIMSEHMHRAVRSRKHTRASISAAAVT